MTRLKASPFWWEAAPRPAVEPQPLPERVDVAVIGSGITGLNAARVLARAGRQVLVLDADVPGYGASSRNAGYVGRTLKHSFLGLTKRHGLPRALAIYRELREAYESVAEVIRSEGIECNFEVCGRFIGANSTRHYDELARELEMRRRRLGDEFEMVPRAAQHREIGSDLYHGGALIPDLASLHPGKYHLGLLAAALRSGATLAGNTRVEAITGADSGFILRTSRGVLRSREVAIATNGYTGSASPWLQRRVVPFDAYMIATEPLGPELVSRVLPRNRTFLDARHNIDFVRRSPDGQHLLFGGRTGSRLPTPEAAAERLHGSLARIFPDLRDIRIGHSWTGRCAATFDFMPHIGVRDGIHYALGYCFAGVPMGTHLGRKLALAMLGAPGRESVFGSRLPSVLLYRGNPWFVPYAMAGFDLLDRWHARN